MTELADVPTVIRFTYTNWKGETSVRRVVPQGLHWGATQWHPEMQWLLLAWDMDRGDARAFPLKDIVMPPDANVGQLHVHESEDYPPYPYLLRDDGTKVVWKKKARVRVWTDEPGTHTYPPASVVPPRGGGPVWPGRGMAG